jgi:hypothetical protein
MILGSSALLPLADGGEPHVVKDFHDELADSLLVVDAADHLDADLGDAFVVGELEADVLQDFDHSLPHTHTRVLVGNIFHLKICWK